MVLEGQETIDVSYFLIIFYVTAYFMSTSTMYYFLLFSFEFQVCFDVFTDWGLNAVLRLL